MSIKKESILIIVLSLCVITVIAVICIFTQVYRNKTKDLVEIQVILSYKTENGEDSQTLKKQYVEQKIIVRNHSGKDILLQCDSNESKDDFVGLGYLDGINNEHEMDNVYSIAYSGDFEYEYVNMYYYEDKIQKEKILNSLMRDYHFRGKEYHYDGNSFNSEKPNELLKDYWSKTILKSEIKLH